MWFFFALATMLAWGAADLFYKKGADETDRYSHLKTTIAVGAVMGAHALATVLFGGIGYDLRNIMIYLPVSLMYISSMAVGYFGLRYLELSISSPVQNASGAIVSIMCFFFLRQSMDAISAAAVVLICIGVLSLGILERRGIEISGGDKKYSRSIPAILIPILYCILDALGTFFDAWYLDDPAKTPLLGVTAENLEDTANTSYELTFLIVAVVLFVYLKLFKKESLALKDQKARFGAAIFETAGQFAYVYAMSGSGIVAAPMVAAYCVVSVILSAIFLKERLTARQYISVALVVLGIVLLGIAEAGAQ